jgi:transcriptional regulator with XRE-family HTH domain
MRQSKGWSQEDMAGKLNLSVNGYANIERGETDVQISRLEKIANIFGIELPELFNFGEKNVFYLATDNQNNANGKNLQSISFSASVGCVLRTILSRTVDLHIQKCA